MPAEAAFLTYYLSEMDRLRVAGSELSQTHGHLAGNLDFHAAETEDPQVARLIESFAFLTARLQQRFDAQFPEIPTALLESLYPQLVAPIPAMAIAEFQVSPKQDRALEGVVVPRGTEIYAPIEGGSDCRFRTGSALPLWPIEVTDVTILSRDEIAGFDDQPDVQACVRVTLSCLGETRTFNQLKPGALRFYLDGDRSARFRLLELLAINVARVAVMRPGATHPVVMPAPGLALRQVGLDPQEALLPYREAAHQGYRLLQEYFAYPDKFMFVELTGITEDVLGTARTLDLLFLLDAEPEANLRVDARSLRLGCVPVINLFPRTSEPIRLDHQSVDYPLEADMRNAPFTEVHTVEWVSRSADDNTVDRIPPYFGADPDKAERGSLRWIARRYPTINPRLSGTDVQLSFVDQALDPAVVAQEVLFARLLCTNRSLARQVSPFTSFKVETDLPIERVHCLARPTPPADPPVAGENLWRLVSHLSLNTLSLGNERGNLEALKQILSLYTGADLNSRRRGQISAIKSLRTRSIVARLGDQRWRGVVRGTEIALEFEMASFIEGSAYLFGAVLDRFFGLYAGVNSFTQLTIRPVGSEKEWTRWPARAGDRPVL